MKAFFKALWLANKTQIIVAAVAAVTVIGGGTVATVAYLNNHAEVAVVDENQTPITIDAEDEIIAPDTIAPEQVEVNNDSVDEVADSDTSEDLGETMAEEIGDKISQIVKPVVTESPKPTVAPVNDDSEDEVTAPSPTPVQPTPSSEVKPEYRTITFVTNSEASIPEKKYEVNALLDNLPSANKKNAIFRGWYYEPDFLTPVASTDVLTKDLTLYAKFTDMNELEYTESSQAIIRKDVEDDFTISVVSRSGKDLATVESQISVENLYDKTAETMVLVDEGPNYLLQFAEGGFDAGASYKVLLLDEDLYFEGENENVKEYNFTADSTPVLNMKYAEDITYLSTNEFSNLIINGNPAEGFSVALFSISENGQEEAEAISGSFKTTKRLEVGSTVTLYDGVRPDLRTLDTPEDQCGDVAYLEITAYDAVTGTYTFKKAEAENVIFVPDMLPINSESPYVEINGNKLVVAASELDFSSDKYSVIGLDSQTTLDAGDFIAFYAGDFSATNTSEVSYVEVLSYIETAEGYEITISEAKG